MHQIAWGLRTSAKPYIGALVLSVIVGFTFMTASSLGTLVRQLASQYVENEENIIGSFAMSYLATFNRGEMGAFGAIAFGICLISAIVSPIPGTLSTSVANPKYLVSLGLNKWHRFFDSVISQSLASVSFLELFILLGLTSLVTLDGGRGKGIVLSLFIWMLLNCISILVLWIVEYGFRRYGSKVRKIFAGIVIGIIGIALILDPNHGRTVFGLGTLFMEVMGNIANYSWGYIFSFVSVLIAFSLVSLFVAGIMSSKTLMLPENILNKDVTAIRSNKRVGAPFALLLKGDSTWKMFANSLFRSPDMLKPIGFVIILGWAISFFMPGSTMVGSTFALSIPMIVALTWGANALAHLSGGGLWLNSAGDALKNAPWIIFLIQFVISVLLSIVVWVPSFVAGMTPFNMFVTNILITVATSLVIGRSAMSKSFAQPKPLHYGARAEATLSPLKTLEYMFRFAMFGGQIGIVLVSLEASFTVILGVTAIIAVWEFLRIEYTKMKWSNPTYRGRVLSSISVDE